MQVSDNNESSQRSHRLSVCLPIYLTVCLSVCLCLSLCLSVCLSLTLSLKFNPLTNVTCFGECENMKATSQVAFANITYNNISSILQKNKISEVNLSALIYRLFDEDFFSVFIKLFCT